MKKKKILEGIDNVNTANSKTIKYSKYDVYKKQGFSNAHVQKDIFLIATAQFNFVMSFYVTFAIRTIQIIAINSLRSSSLEILGDAIRNDIEKLASSIFVAEKHALLRVLYILDVLCCQPIKLFQVVSTSECHEY